MVGDHITVGGYAISITGVSHDGFVQWEAAVPPVVSGEPDVDRNTIDRALAVRHVIQHVRHVIQQRNVTQPEHRGFAVKRTPALSEP
jgi:hypothetical protein